MNTLITFAFSPTLDAESPTEFAGVAYSGQPVNYGDFGALVVDLDSLSAPKKPVFALVNHDPNQRAGRMEFFNARTELQVKGSFSKATAIGRQVAEEFAEGGPWEFSIGVGGGRIERFKSPREVTFNGRSMLADSVLYNGRIREVSFVPAGADESTTVVAFSLQESDFLPASLESTMTDEAFDELKSAHADLKLQLAKAVTDHQSEINDLTARLSAVTDQAKAEAEQVQALTIELSAMKTEQRVEAVKDLFLELERTFTDEAAKPYLELSAHAFSLLSTDLRALKSPVELKDSYFTDTTPKGKPVENEVDFSVQLFKQVAGRA